MYDSLTLMRDVSVGELATGSSAPPHATASGRIALDGDIDPRAVVALQHQITGTLDAGHRRVVVDLGAATVLDASTLSLLRAALQCLELGRRGATVEVVGAFDDLRRVVGLCAIDGVELQLRVPLTLMSLSGSRLATDRLPEVAR